LSYFSLVEHKAVQWLGHLDDSQFSGFYKTPAVFDRYHSVSDRGMKRNARKARSALKAKETSAVHDGGARQVSGSTENPLEFW
jgi:hypothetical protein